MSTYWPDKARVLLSFAYRGAVTTDDSLAYGGSTADFLIDSGAFTAFTKGEKIDRVEYCEWLLKEAKYITHAAALDVIGDWKASAKNYEWMLNRLGDKVKILPAWHLGSPLEELDRLCRETDYMAIGGCVPYSKQPKVLMRHLIQAHKVAAKHGTKLHGLGITGRETMTRLPWHSVDSSAWQSGHRFGGMILSDRRGQQRTINIGKPLPVEDKALVRAYGGDPARVSAYDFNLVARAGVDQARKDRTWTNMASARGFQNIEGHLRAKHGTKFSLYLATPSQIYAVEAIKGHGLGSPFAPSHTPVLPSA